MEDVFAAFERWGFDTKGWSRQTRYAYVLRAHRAHEWLEAQRETTITHATLRDLSAYHAATTPNARNRNSIRQALLGFYGFLASTGRRDDNPAASLPRMPEPRSLPKALTGAQMQAVLAAAQLHGPMWHTYVLLLAYTGMRRDEARTLEWTGFEDDWVRFTAKGNRERVLPLHPDAKSAMLRWRAECSSPRWIMPSPEFAGPISTSAIHRHMHAIGDTANVPWLHSHALRHTYATGLLETGADIATVQQAMGHAALSSTQVYLRVRDGRVREAVASLAW